MRCRFCEIAAGTDGLPRYDIPYLRSSSFFATATVGALVPGWSLLCSNRHQLSLRSYYDNSEFKAFYRKAITLTVEAYGPVIVFEHGAANCTSLTGCGVNHAHLHVVPSVGSLLELMHRDGRWRQLRASELRDVPPDTEYLFYSENAEAGDDLLGYFKLIEKPSSQYFRRLVAEKMGRANEFDYKSHPCLSEAVTTSVELSARAA